MGEPSGALSGRRLRVLAILAAVSALLLVLRLLLPGSTASIGGGMDGPAFRRKLVAVVDSLIGAYGIDRRGVKTRTVTLPGGAAVRTEQRISVDPDFVSLRFNHDLSRSLRWTGARVVGIERVRERLTTLHVVREGTTLWTLRLVPTSGS